MALTYEKAVKEDLEIGSGTVSRTMPGGGSATGNMIGSHTFLDDVVNLKHFGAVGDNTTDDTTAVENWLNKVQALGGIGYAPPGRYRINRALTVTLTNDNPFTIMGAGGGSGASPYGTHFVLTANLANNDTPMIKITSASQSSFVEVSGIRFTGDDKTGCGLYIEKMTHRVIVRRCNFRNFAGRGLWLHRIIGVLIEGVHAEENGVNFEHSGISSIGEGVIVGSKFAKGAGATTTRNVHLNTGSTFLTFVGCTFYGESTIAGVDLTPVLGTATNPFGVGFYQCNFESEAPGIYCNNTATVINLTVEGCYFNPSVASGTGYGIDIDALHDSRIQNNSFDVAPASGATAIGLRLATTSTRNQIGPNRFSNSGAGTLTEYSLPQPVPFLQGIANDGTAFPMVDYNATLQMARFRSGGGQAVAQDATVNLDNSLEGFAVVFSLEDDASCLFHLRGPSGAVAIVSDPASLFSVADGTSSKVNLYWSSGNSRYELENKRTASRTLSILLLSA